MDIRDQLRRDHAKALVELGAIGSEADGRRAQVRLARLRQAWRVHALAEETVVYRALEGVAPAGADERFVEHELVEGLFEKLSHARAGTHEWHARVNVLRELITRHVESEEGGLFLNLSERYSAEELADMGRNFILARDKLSLLEEAKKAA